MDADERRMPLLSAYICVHLWTIFSASGRSLPSVVGSKKRRRGERPGSRKHTTGTAYGCSLSDLTRFTAGRCIGPGRLPRRSVDCHVTQATDLVFSFSSAESLLTYFFAP